MHSFLYFVQRTHSKYELEALYLLHAEFRSWQSLKLNLSALSRIQLSREFNGSPGTSERNFSIKPGMKQTSTIFP
jgi:hypothetical protein